MHSRVKEKITRSAFELFIAYRWNFGGISWAVIQLKGLRKLLWTVINCFTPIDSTAIVLRSMNKKIKRLAYLHRIFVFLPVRSYAESFFHWSFPNTTAYKSVSGVLARCREWGYFIKCQYGFMYTRNDYSDKIENFYNKSRTIWKEAELSLVKFSSEQHD